ncbi:MAG TPA: TetR/AcrR family transcriptional regulator [Reyranella sp.]|jgi:AcrR family transcriptional regulator|nr:TetR/AcrR family transcriptional regulator [Reyranella sp.]
MPAAGSRKRRGERHTRRDEILAAAKQLFLREGYEATTIRKIADRVGVSAPALYLYFADKEAILLALCDQTFGFLIEEMGRIDREGPVDSLRACGRAYIRFGLEHPSEYWLTFISGDTAKSTGAAAFARLVEQLKAIEAAGIRLRYPADTAAELFWMGLHGLVSALINNREFPWTKREQLIDGMIDLATNGIVA